MQDYKTLYRQLHDCLSKECQEKKFIKNIEESIYDLIKVLPKNKKIILRPYGATTRWLIEKFELGKFDVACYDPKYLNGDAKELSFIADAEREENAIFVNTSYNYREQITYQLSKSGKDFLDLYCFFEKRDIFLRTNPEEYRETTHAIPNYFYCKWYENKNKVNLKELMIAAIESYDFVLLEKLCREYMDIYDFVEVVWERYLKLKEEISVRLRSESRKKDMIIHWLDAVPNKWLKHLPLIHELANKGIYFENTYSCTPFTHQTLRAMISGILPLSNFEKSMKLIDETSKGIKLLEQYGLRFIQIGHDGADVSSCLDKYTYNFDRNVSCNYIYWKCIEEMINSDTPLFLIAHAVIETHPPMLSTMLLKPNYNLNSGNYEEQRNSSYSYIDERVVYYMKLFGVKTQLVLSDHGEHISKSPEMFWMQNKLHTWCLVFATGIAAKKEQRLFPYYNFIDLIRYLITRDESFYEKLFDEYILFQDTDFYNEQVIDSYIKEGIAEYIIAYSGATDGTFKYAINGAGHEFFYKIEDDNDVEMYSENKRLHYLKEVTLKKFPDTSHYERFEHSKKLYREINKK